MRKILHAISTTRVRQKKIHMYYILYRIILTIAFTIASTMTERLGLTQNAFVDVVQELRKPLVKQTPLALHSLKQMK